MMIHTNERMRQIIKKKTFEPKIDFEQWRNIYSTNIHRWTVRGFLHIHQDDFSFYIDVTMLVITMLCNLFIGQLRVQSINRAAKRKKKRNHMMPKLSIGHTTTPLLQCQWMNEFYFCLSFKQLLLKLEASASLQKYRLYLHHRKTAHACFTTERIKQDGAELYKHWFYFLCFAIQVIKLAPNIWWSCRTSGWMTPTQLASFE